MCMCCGGMDEERFAINAIQKKKTGVVGRERALKTRMLTGDSETLHYGCVCNFITVAVGRHI